MSDNDNDDMMDTIRSAVEEQKKAEPETEKVEESRPEAVEAPEPEEKEAGTDRDEKGRFKPKEVPTKGEELETKEEQKPVEAVDKSEPDKLDISRPPRRLPIRTKGIWQTLSEPLREDIVAREAEFDKAFKRYDGLGQYAMEAEKNGTSLTNAVRDFAQVENTCRRDPCAGVDLLAGKLGWNHRALAYAMAVRHGIIAGQEGEQQRQEQLPTREELLASVRAEREVERANDIIENFKNDPKNIYFEDVRQEMAKIVNAGLASDIKDAYDKACKLHPEIARLNGSQVAGSERASKTAATNQARQQAKAIGGAPSHESNAARPPDDGNQSIYDTVRAAVAKQRGA